ncbi:MAG TPA: hypothetical protein PJ988_18985, partial [Anaerolinea sp.]|nr:hypothetical protein [Anaerolinea sp.]
PETLQPFPQEPAYPPQQPVAPVYNSRPARPAPQPAQNSAAPQAPAAQEPQPAPSPAQADSLLPPLFSPDIIILTIVAIVLWVGMLPFGAYVLLRLGILGAP